MWRHRVSAEPPPAKGGRVPGGRPGGRWAGLTRALPQLFRVQVRCGGRRHTQPRLYSEFHALHKRVRRPSTLRLRPGSCPKSWGSLAATLPTVQRLGGGSGCSLVPSCWPPPSPSNPHAPAEPVGFAHASWQIKKRCKVPDFPAKRLPGWRSRGLEQQRLGLEAYIQVCGVPGGVVDGPESSRGRGRP